MKAQKNEPVGLLLVSSVLLYWGFTTVMMKHALVYMSSTTYTMARFLVAAIPLLPLYGRKLAGQMTRKLFLHGCVLGLLEMIPMQTSTLALSYTSTANVVFVSQLSFVLVPLAQCILFKKLPSLSLILTICFLLLGLGIFSQVAICGIGIGTLLSVLTALGRCCSILCVKRFVETDDPLMLGVLQILTCALFSIPVWLTAPSRIQWCTGSVSILFFTGVIGSAVAFLAYIVGQAKTTPITVSFLNLIQPIVSMIGAAVLADPAGNTEPITGNMILGSAIILLTLTSYLLVNRESKKQSKEAGK